MALRRGGRVARRETAKRLTRRIKAAGRSQAKKLNGPINLRAGRDFFRENTYNGTAARNFTARRRFVSRDIIYLQNYNESGAARMERAVRIAKKLLPFAGAAVFLLAVYAIHRELAGVRLSELRAAFAETGAEDAALALLAVALNYAVLAANEALAVAEDGGGLPWRRTAPVSFIANAVGFNLGASAISGGAVRWRLYSALGLDPARIGRVIASTQAAFVLGPMTAGALAFVIAPDAVFARAAWLGSARWLLAALCLAVPAAAFTFSFRGSIPWIEGQRLALPSPRGVAAKCLLGFLDIATASLVLGFALHAEGAPFFALFSAYALSALLGSLSQIPGGLGAFDVTFMLLMSPFCGHAHIVSALLLYRFLYYIVPLALATALLLLTELNGRFAGALGRISFFLPDAAALCTFVAGVWLLVSTGVALPPDGAAKLAAFPLPLLEASHFMRSLAGTLLLFLAWGVARRLKSAWRAAVAVLALSLLITMIGPFRPIRTAFLLLLLAALFFSRREFYRLSFFSNPGPAWSAAILAAACAALWWGFFSYRTVEFRGDMWWTFTFTEGAPRFLRAAAGASFTLLAAFLVLWLRPAKLRMDCPTPEKIRELVAASGDSEAALALLGDKRFFMSADGRAAVMYAVSGAFWISMGDPIGDRESVPALIWDFCEAADLRGASAAFYEAGGDWLPVYGEAGLKISPVGDEARVDLSEITGELEGPKWRKLRPIRKRAAADGISFRVVEGAELDAVMPRLAEISREWLESVHGGEKGFSLGFFDEGYMRNFPVAVAEKEGAIFAFCNLWLGGDGSELSVDLMRYGKDAPRDIMTCLFLEVMLWGKARGFRWFRLGMAPLSNLDPDNSLFERLGGFIYEHGEHFYNFKGLRQYKEKFSPEWRRRYLVYKDTFVLPALVSQLVRLVSSKRGPGCGCGA